MFKSKYNFTGINLAFMMLVIIETLGVTPSSDRPGLHPLSNTSHSHTTVTIPALNDWQVGSLAFARGAEGTWDHYLWGGFANSLIKKDGVYYLYYQGAPSYDEQCDSVASRGIGVATSVDGVNWVKSPKNPVITWSSQGSLEEGAASSAAWVGNDGRIYIYYGANTGSGCIVHANARLAVSEDGENFQDLGAVLAWNDPTVWGSGDEIFPVGAYSHENKWYLYYIPNGVPLSRKLGVAVGGSYNAFTQTMGVNGSTIPAWGPVSVVSDTSAGILFVNAATVPGLINIYTFSLSAPALVNFHDAYTFSDCTRASVLYDDTLGRWLMACRNADQTKYLIKYAGVPSPATFVSSGGHDGWIREAGEFSRRGGSLNRASPTLRVGDDSANQQYRTILSFNTSALPDTAVISSVTLKIKSAGFAGVNPFLTHGALLVDIRRGAFRNEPRLGLDDFNASASKNQALILANTLVDGWYVQTLNPIDFQFIHPGGLTQFRLRFARDDNNDFGSDFLKFFSGHALNETDRPQLIIEYSIP